MGCSGLYLSALVADDEVLDGAVVVVPEKQVEPNGDVGRMNEVGRSRRHDRFLTESPDVTEKIGSLPGPEAVVADSADVVVLAALQVPEDKVVQVFGRHQRLEGVAEEGLVRHDAEQDGGRHGPGVDGQVDGVRLS